MASSPVTMTLDELAPLLSARLIGDGATRIRALAALDTADADQLSFAVGTAQRSQLKHTRAAAVIVTETLADEANRPALVVEDAYAAFARASWIINPEAMPQAGIHPTATVHETARVPGTVSIGAGAVIGAGCTLEPEVVIAPGVVVGDRVRIGAGSRLFARVVLGDDVHLGMHCRVQSGAVIGSEGFGYAQSKGQWQAIHQVGGVRIGDRVHVGANTTIDCGTLEPTVIESGVILDNQIQIAHNVHIGENTAIAGCTGIAGSTRIGRQCLIGGACNIIGHLQIADGVVLNATSFVTQSIDKAGRYGSGMPLLSAREWKRSFLILKRLNELLQRVRGLERERGQAVSNPNTEA